MKEIITFLVVLCLSLSLTACSNNDNDVGSSTIGTAQSVIHSVETETSSNKEGTSAKTEDDIAESDFSYSSNETADPTKPNTSTTNEVTQSNKPSSTTNPNTSKVPEKTESSITESKPIKEPEPPQYETFTYTIGDYTIENVEKEKGSDEYYAYLSSYTLDNSETYRKNFITKFKSSFGYKPNAKLVCTTIGIFKVKGYEDPQVVYQISVSDDTYPLITDEFYVLKKKICADGSAWVGFPIPCSMDNMESSVRVSKLLKEMNNIFCEWTGYDYSYISQNDDKFMVNMVSEAGKMRTLDGKITDVVYRYTRGVNMPL